MTSNTHQSDGEIILAIELSNPNATPDAHAGALFMCSSRTEKQTQLIGSMPIPSGLRSSDAIMVLVDTLCTKHQIAPAQIARILVSVGPGGYTALRIAATTAKVLAHTLGCSLVAVPSALVAAQEISASNLPALIGLASKNQQTHGSLVHADGRVESLGVIDADGISSLGIKAIVADKHLPQSIVDRAASLEIRVVPIVLDARRCVDAAAGIEAIDPIELAPIYAREPDAITQWRARTPKSDA